MRWRICHSVEEDFFWRTSTSLTGLKDKHRTCVIRLHLTRIDPLDPYQLAETYNVILLSPHEVPEFTPEIINRLLVVDPDTWSAGSLPLPDGKVIILMNPTHSLTRRHATLMEELAHIHLKHKPSGLVVVAGFLTTRTFNKTNETKAYWVGAAALVTLKLC